MMIRLVLELNDADGSLQMEGPLDNKVICYGILELAKEVIAKRGVPTAKTGLFVPGPPMGIPPDVFKKT